MQLNCFLTFVDTNQNSQIELFITKLSFEYKKSKPHRGVTSTDISQKSEKFTSLFDHVSLNFYSLLIVFHTNKEIT